MPLVSFHNTWKYLKISGGAKWVNRLPLLQEKQNIEWKLEEFINDHCLPTCTHTATDKYRLPWQLEENKCVMIMVIVSENKKIASSCFNILYKFLKVSMINDTIILPDNRLE